LLLLTALELPAADAGGDDGGGVKYN